MAKFLEYQGKEWLGKAGLPVPKGRAASTPEEAKQVAEWIGGPVAVKGQVQAGGRGKAGIVKLVNIRMKQLQLLQKLWLNGKRTSCSGKFWLKRNWTLRKNSIAPLLLIMPKKHAVLC
jgi:succinyl-CoA synthetase beta subunit